MLLYHKISCFYREVDNAICDSTSKELKQSL